MARSGLTTLLSITMLALSVLLAMPAPSAAQNPFEPAIRINDRIVTRFELDQRTLFLTLLNAGADPRNIARQQLVSERLQFDAAQRAGISVEEEAVIAAQANFAAQGQFEREQFIEALAQNGVEEGTFRNFIEAGLVWREVVRARFSDRVQVSEEDIDRALAQIPAEGGVRVLISEIILPAQDPATLRASRTRAERLSRITGFDEFADAARRFSAAPSRQQGGEIGWRPLSALPQDAANQLQRLAPGQVTRPILLPEAVALFQLRDRETVPAGSVDVISADYAEYFIPGGRSPEALSEAARLRQIVRTCDDLYGVARDAPDRLNRQTTRIEQLPADVAREITALDDNEVSTNLTRGGNLVFLMLCERTVRESASVDRAQVRQALTAQRLETFAAGYLNELRQAAEIETLQ